MTSASGENDDYLDRECSYCMEREIALALVPCGHGCCKPCATKQQKEGKCWTCKADVTTSSSSASVAFAAGVGPKGPGGITDDAWTEVPKSKKKGLKGSDDKAAVTPARVIAGADGWGNQGGGVLGNSPNAVPQASLVAMARGCIKKEASGRGSRREILVDLSNKGLTDQDIISMAPALLAALQDILRQETGGFPALVVSLQHNSVGDGGTEALCRVLQMIREADLAYTKYLKLFYNDVSDGGAAAITTLLETHARMAGADRRCQVQECHLSHNCITSEGARRLIVQAERSYPYVDTSGARVPLWLRMEGNLIDPAQLASILPPLCPAGEGGCNSKRCALGKNAPFCHLPFIDKQCASPQARQALEASRLARSGPGANGSKPVERPRTNAALADFFPQEPEMRSSQTSDSDAPQGGNVWASSAWGGGG
eukprot:CAMPEP_0180375128 /NCGR_PEP_ID=MMETSP0989-20121125/22463_1 /TAXON_ID=697907 /ORGANISM="non described non described, Strain CCMP2293" /LENGTH=427 /DNA_ID=CAMNT_0022372749 /DNA_START=30 /DNA_END=1309 /DNA_ORIENTATION=+